MFDFDAVRAAVAEAGLSGWLLYDFRGLNVLARRVVRMPEDKHLSRRWFYFVPAQGEPRKLIHRIESAALDHLPGDAVPYLRWQELEAGLKDILSAGGEVAMEYSPRNANPYISRVDAGTVELVRSLGVQVVPSGDLIQRFEAVWGDAEWASHQESAKLTRAAFDSAYAFIAERIRANGSVRETEVQAHIMQYFADNNLVTDHPPIVGEGPHSGDPHYSPGDAGDAEIKPGSFVLVDLWAKLDRPGSVYSDFTRTAFVGVGVPAKYTEVFNVVAAARDAAINRVKSAFAAGEELQGWQVDQAARDVIEAAGHGALFVHRLGHNIGQETHGNGCHMDNLETHETRLVMRDTCFSVEPGVYRDDFGVRSEVNVYVGGDGTVHVTGDPIQREIDLIRV